MFTIQDRYVKSLITKDLHEKMVFIGGPRQVGKTTFSLSLLPTSANETHPAYLNWDVPKTRPPLLEGELPANEPLIILDEIHKFARWRNLVKGIYDSNKSSRQILVTGSARLDYYRKGGDSLQGRYHYWRLHPFSLPELSGSANLNDTDLLLRFGGFPEPFLKGEERFWRRWQRERAQRVIYEDIRDLENVREISLLELLALDLPNRVGSPLSVKNLKETLQVAHETVARWLEIFERLYYCFRISPFGAPRIRAVKKEQKLYLWDWSLITDPGPRFENMVACHLLKYCHFKADSEGYNMELRYLRDTDKREVDFVIICDGNPLFAVECKTSERQISPALAYFKSRTPIPYFYQVHTGIKDIEKNGIRVLPFHVFCNELALP
jgi:uncharacterized protein